MPRRDVMLCYMFDEKRFNRWPKPCIVQPKYNGKRCRAVVRKDKHVELYSSQGNMIVSVPHINKQLSEFPAGVYDGELYIHDMPLQDLMTMVQPTQYLHPDREKVEYHIFDIINNETQFYRLRILTKIFFDFVDSTILNLVQVPWKLVTTMKDLEEHFTDFVSRGFEGIILRNHDALYKPNKSVDIMKLKPHDESVVTIMDFQEEISIYGEPKGSLGALICETDDGVVFHVGSGFTRHQREVFWRKRDAIERCLIVLKHQGLSNDGVPLFPVFLKWVDKSELLRRMGLHEV